MHANILFFAWNRSIAGREKISAPHYQEFVQYLTGLQQGGKISSFDAFLLEPHGGDMNGGFIIKGDAAKLDALVSTTDWITHMTRAALHLEGAGAVRGVTGAAIGDRMALWAGLIPA